MQQSMCQAHRLTNPWLVLQQQWPPPAGTQHGVPVSQRDPSTHARHSSRPAVCCRRVAAVQGAAAAAAAAAVPQSPAPGHRATVVTGPAAAAPRRRASTTASAAAAAGGALQQPPPEAGPAAGSGSKKKQTDKLPLQQRILNGILNVSNVPYSSFVPHPVTPLHKVDAQIKQLWLLMLYIIIARATPWLRLSIAGVVAALSIACLPRRLWASQLRRLGFICALIAAFTALGADGVPPVLQPHSLPASLEGVHATLQPGTPYSYVVFNLFGWVTITRRSFNLAITAAALTFCALQSASLCLVTTPGEEMALGLSRWLAPLRPLGVPTRRIALTLLLSLRFMSLVFEEVRNLCLGLAARGVDWAAQGGRGSLEIMGRLVVRLFGNLFTRSEKISQAMVVRGFLGPEQHHMYLMRSNETTLLANVTALGLLAALCALVAYLK